MLGYKLTNHTCIIDVLNSGKDKVHVNFDDPGVCLGCPEFSSGFIWELNLIDTAPESSTDFSDYYVRVLYDGIPILTHCPRESLKEKYFCPYRHFKRFHEE